MVWVLNNTLAGIYPIAVGTQLQLPELTDVVFLFLDEC